MGPANGRRAIPLDRSPPRRASLAGRTSLRSPLNFWKSIARREDNGGAFASDDPVASLPPSRGDRQKGGQRKRTPAGRRALVSSVSSHLGDGPGRIKWGRRASESKRPGAGVRKRSAHALICTYRGGGDPIHPKRFKSRFDPPHIRNCGAAVEMWQTVKNLGNGILRPEIFGQNAPGMPLRIAGPLLNRSLARQATENVVCIPVP